MGRLLRRVVVRAVLCAGLLVAFQAPSAAVAADTYEPNNDWSSAYSVSGPTTLTSYISTATDEDWYKLTVTWPGHLRLFLDVPNGYDYDLSLYGDPPPWPSMRVSDGGVSADETIEYTILNTGTYYVCVDGYGSSYSSTTPYQLSIGALSGDTNEPNDVVYGANPGGPLLDGVPCDSYIFTENDSDYFIVNTTSAGQVQINLDVPAGLDYDLYFRELSWPLWVDSSLNGAGVDESIVYACDGPASYLVMVSSPAGHYNRSTPYRLTASGAGITICNRLAGDSRIETAIAVSERAFPFGASTAVVATSRNYPDALAGAVLAQAYNGPLLLTEPNAMMATLYAELQRLGVTKVFVLGGESAVSEYVADFIAGDEVEVERIAGSNRYETSRRIAEEVVAKRGYPSTAIVATGRNFADALAASPYAARKGYPILLTDRYTLSADTRAALQSMGVSQVYLMGGDAAISWDVDDAIQAMGISVSRVAGDTRVDTAIEMARIATADGMSMTRPLLATGYNFPDALAGGVLGARLGSPLLLTHPGGLSSATSAYMNENRVGAKEVVVLGGFGAVSLGVQQSVDAIY